MPACYWSGSTGKIMGIGSGKYSSRFLPAGGTAGTLRCSRILNEVLQSIARTDKRAPRTISWPSLEKQVGFHGGEMGAHPPWTKTI